MTWGVFTHHELNPIIYVSIKFNGNHYKALLVISRSYLRTSVFLTMMGCSNATMNYFIGLQMSKTGLKSTLECFSHPNMNPIEHLWDVVERATHIQDPPSKNLGNFEQIFRQHDLTSIRRSSVYLWNPCYVEILHFSGLEGAYTFLDGYPMIFGMSLYIK